MQIKNAYIVCIDFDGDIINSKYSWGCWLIFTELEDVKKVVTEALTDLMRHQKEMGIDATVPVGYRDVPITDILAKERLLKLYIKHGGGSPSGNWKISIRKTGD